MAKNLLEETKKELAEHGKTLDDIICYRIGDYQITREQFEKYADIYYIPIVSWLQTEVNDELKLIGKDFWLERNCDEEYNAEWWEYRWQSGTNLPYADKVGYQSIFPSYDGNDKTEHNGKLFITNYWKGV